MLSEIDLQNILFLDIETVPGVESFDMLPPRFQALWEKKSLRFREEEEEAAEVYSRAGIYAEFGKIICISAGIVTTGKQGPGLRLKSYFGDDENTLLLSFAEMLENFGMNRTLYLCAHNGKEFDYPYLARRMLVNGIKLPAMLDVAGRKPWEVHHLDTMELWKFGDYKHYTSLELLTTLFDIPSPKDDMDGSKVAEVYYKDKDMKKIVEYCQHDVIAVVQLLMRYKGMELIPEEHIEVAE